MKREIKENKYFRWGVTAFSVIAVALVWNYLLNRMEYVLGLFRLVLGALRPVILGIVFAYLLNPLEKTYEKYVFSKLFGKIGKKKADLGESLAGGFSIFLSVVTAVALVLGLVWLIIPELYVNINRLVTNMPGYVENTITYLTDLSEKYPEMINPVIDYFENISTDILTWAKDKVLPSANSIITNLSVGIYGTLKVMLDVGIGLIVAVYVLMSKDKYISGIKKYTYAFLKRERADKIITLVNYTEAHFGGFLIGKMVDSAIIGVLAFIVFSIFNIPYALLVSVIVGVTNIIPFFGPFIGAVPCGILILLVSPLKAITFVILIFVIQQIDGNVIGPKILGEATGLDSFAIIFSILLFGGLFGVVGMLVGVPIVATVFGLFAKLAEKKLALKNMPVASESYIKEGPFEETIEKSGDGE